MTTALVTLSVLLAVAIIVAAVGWYRYFQIQGYVRAIDGVLGAALKKEPPR